MRHYQPVVPAEGKRMRFPHHTPELRRNAVRGQVELTFDLAANVGKR
jgi:hypothetical protein